MELLVVVDTIGWVGGLVELGGLLEGKGEALFTQIHRKRIARCCKFNGWRSSVAAEMNRMLYFVCRGYDAAATLKSRNAT